MSRNRFHDVVIAAAIALLAAAGPAAAQNLTVTAITPVVQCYVGQCSVYFNNTVCNTGAATAFYFAVGSRWTAGGTIWTCTGLWDAQITVNQIPAGQCRTLVTYGPGFVGPKISYGACMGVQTYADIYCRVPETSEADNATGRMFCAS